MDCDPRLDVEVLESYLGNDFITSGEGCQQGRISIPHVTQAHVSVPVESQIRQSPLEPPCTANNWHLYLKVSFQVLPLKEPKKDQVGWLTTNTSFMWYGSTSSLVCQDFDLDLKTLWLCNPTDPNNSGLKQTCVLQQDRVRSLQNRNHIMNKS